MSSDSPEALCSDDLPDLLRLGKNPGDSERPQRLASQAVTGQAILLPTLPDEVIEQLWL